MKNKKDLIKDILWICGVILIICIFIVAGAFGVIFLVDEQNKRTNYDELTYYDFNIDYDDDSHYYEIFTKDKTHMIHKSNLDVYYGNETYIVIFDNNYDWFHNKAILVIGVSSQPQQDIDISICIEEFEFDYEEEIIAKCVTKIDNIFYKVELFSETQYAVYILNVEKNETYNYINGSN